MNQSIQRIFFESVAVIIAAYACRKPGDNPIEIKSEKINEILQDIEKKHISIKDKNNSKEIHRIAQYFLRGHKEYQSKKYLSAANCMSLGLKRVIDFLSRGPINLKEKIKPYTDAQKFFEKISQEIDFGEPYGTRVSKSNSENMLKFISKSELPEVLVLTEQLHVFPSRKIQPTHAKMHVPRLRARTVFDLTPDELRELRSLDYTVTAMSPAPSGRGGDCYDIEIRERYRDRLRQAKANRSAWLKAQRISATVARQAAATLYDPYRHAAFIGLVAPPMPDGYEQAVLTFEQKEAKDKAQRIANVKKLNARPDNGDGDIYV
ncbi:MAG: hypothetical protein ACOYB2_15140 [Limnohabitans sp.]